MTTPTTMEKKLLRHDDVLETTSMSKSTLVAAGQNGPVPRTVQTRRSDHQSRALAACGSRRVDSQLGANPQRVTAALSAALGCQVSRCDRPKRSTAIPASPISKQGTRDVGRGRTVNSSGGADLQASLA